ncbi:translation elongation factor EF-G [Cryobacterium psychrotolerans]|nr:translation elongation factor EF-G [Cryobacterium psychrotolerans]
MPRGVVISRIDHPRARYETVLTELQHAFGSSVVPVSVPIRTAGGITGGKWSVPSRLPAARTGAVECGG